MTPQRCIHEQTAQTCDICLNGATPAPKRGTAGRDPINAAMTDQAIWQTRQHSVVTGRTRKGRTTQRVVRFGAASVIGAYDCDIAGNPLLAAAGPDEHQLAASGAAARLLLRAQQATAQLADIPERDRAAFMRDNYLIAERRSGKSAIDVGRITDAAYSEDQLPRMLNGTDVRQYEQVIHKDRSAAAQVTAHTVGLAGDRSDIAVEPRLVLRPTMFADGTYSVSASCDTSVSAILEHSEIGAGDTDTEIHWPTRGTAGVQQFGRLAGYEPRNDEPITDRVFRVAPDGTCERVVRVVSLTAELRGLPATSYSEHAQVPASWCHNAYGTYHNPAPATRLAGVSGTVRLLAGVTSVTDHSGRLVLRSSEQPAARIPRESVFIGHLSCDRSRLAAELRNTAREDRTDVHSDQRPTTAAAWSQLLSSLAAGRRAAIADISVTVTERGDWCATTPAGRIRVRSCAALCDRLAAL